MASLLFTLQAGNAAIAATPAPAAQAAFTADDLMLLEVLVDNRQLTDSFGAYSSRAGLYLPLGELVRLLDLPIVVDPGERKADGWFLSESRRFLLEADRLHAEIEGKPVQLEPGSLRFMDDELFVRIDVMQKLLPVNLKADLSGLTLQLSPREKLPFQARLEREQRRRGIAPGDGAAQEAAKKIDVPYDWFSPPAADLNLSLGHGNQGTGNTAQWVLRAAGDLALTEMRAFMSSDSQSSPRALRLQFDRQFGGQDNKAPWRVSAGDTYTPSLPLGIGSHGGRGINATNASSGMASVFDQVNLRGELPTGYEVELYVNEVLRGSQSNGVQGRYEFLNVPLAYGLNVVRLAFYGPRGERYEEVRRLNVGGGQLAAGQSSFELGLVESGSPLVSLRSPTVDPRLFDPGYGRMLFAATMAYGLTSALTARLNVGQYAPTSGAVRQVAGAGLSTNLSGIAVQFDAATDSLQGRGESLGLAGRLLSIPLLLRHTEYQGGFIDEREPGAADPTHPLARTTSLRADFQPRIPGTQRNLPLSLDLSRRETTDGATIDAANLRVSLFVARLLASTSIGYSRTTDTAGRSDDILAGAVDVSTLLGGPWQLRASTSYTLRPQAELTSTSLTIDRRFGNDTVLRAGVVQGWTPGGTTGITAGASWRLPSFNVTLNASYVPQTGQYLLGLQFSLGTLFDPLRGRYAMGGPDAAVSGALSVNAFVDANGDGKRDADEVGVPGIGAMSGRGMASTGREGRLLATGLPDGLRSTVALRLDGVEDPYLIAPATKLELTPRAGKVIRIDVPMQQTGEAALRVQMAAANGSLRGIAALDVELVDVNGNVKASGRTEYDGTVLFEGLPAGRYLARLRPEQAARLKLRFVDRIVVDITTQGGFSGLRDVRIELEH